MRPPPHPCSNIWMHTRCYDVPDDQPVPDAFVCDQCQAAKRQRPSPGLFCSFFGFRTSRSCRTSTHE